MKERIVLRSLGREPLIYKQTGHGPDKRTLWKSQVTKLTKGHVTVETNTGGLTQHA